MTQLSETIDRVISSLKTKEWVKCPLCLEEWNKLRPCSYMNDGRTIGTYVCATCAESIQSLEKVFNIFGLDVAIHTKLRKKPYDELSRTYGDYFDNPRAFKCIVENASPVVTADIETTEDMRLSLTHRENKSSIRFGNIFQCASYFKHLIEETKKKPMEEKRGWGYEKE
jgi:hypothetical protein